MSVNSNGSDRTIDEHFLQGDFFRFGKIFHKTHHYYSVIIIGLLKTAVTENVFTQYPAQGNKKKSQEKNSLADNNYHSKILNISGCLVTGCSLFLATFSIYFIL